MSKPVTLEANEIVGGARRDEYGDAVESFSRVAALWSVILNKQVSPSQVAQCMIALKLSREMNHPKRDNRVDICGYAELLDGLENAKLNWK